MLTRNELTDLYDSYSSTRVLSVYIDADQHDPAERDVWRIALKQGLASQRERIADTERAEEQALDRAAEHVRRAMGVSDSSFLPGRGWVGFATPDELIHAESLPVPVPNLIRWERGLRVAPYVRVLKQSRPVILALVDQRRAAILRYLQGELEPVRELHADTFVGDLTDIGMRKVPAQRTGIRGKTGTDAAQSILQVATDRLIDRLASEIREGCGNGECFVVLGGISEQIAALRNALPEALGANSVSRPSLHFDMTDAELREAVEEAASELTESLHRTLLDEVIEGAGADAGACLGPDDTEQALQAQRVRVLLVSAGLAERDPDYADRLIGTAFGSNGAHAHILTREIGERLDREADGVGAALHY